MPEIVPSPLTAGLVKKSVFNVIKNKNQFASGSKPPQHAQYIHGRQLWEAREKFNSCPERSNIEELSSSSIRWAVWGGRVSSSAVTSAIVMSALCFFCGRTICYFCAAVGFPLSIPTVLVLCTGQREHYRQWYRTLLHYINNRPYSSQRQCNWIEQFGITQHVHW